MARSGLSLSLARRLYDRLGRLYDLAAVVETRGRSVALDSLRPLAGDRILNMGCGTGLGVLLGQRFLLLRHKGRVTIK